MKVSIIAAVSENRVIGVENHLPWHIPEDLKRFKALTMGHPMIMGRKTFESIGKPLPGRTNIVLTRDPLFQKEGLEVFHNLEEAIQSCRDAGAEEVFIIGGGQIYEQAISYADRLYLTVVHQTVPGDTLFPDFDTTHEFVLTKEELGDAFSFQLYDRKVHSTEKS